MKFMKSFIMIVILSSAAQAAEVVDKIVASVSTELVLLSDIRDFPKRLDRLGSIDDTLFLGNKPTDLATNSAKQIEFLVREKMLEAEIKRLGLSLTDSQVDSEVNQLAKRGNMTSEDFKNYLSEQGYTLSEFKKLHKTRLERQSFFEREIISKLRITDNDALSVFQAQNPGAKSGVSEFKIAQIFFSNKNGGAEKSAERAQAAYENLSAGETFEALANRLDETPGANQNGYLGSFKSGEFIPEIEREIATLNENQVSRIIRGPNGFHIVKLLSKTVVQDPRFLRVKESIKSQLVQQNFERQLKNWFEFKKNELDIKIYDKAL